MKLERALRGLAAVTIDVDTLDCYRAIHGLEARRGAPDPIYTAALPRFLDILDHLGVPGTLFVIGQDLEREEARDALRSAHGDDHEIASHSFGHDYRLSRRPREQIVDDLRRADEAIEDAVGRRPAGFRAPGYNQSDALFDAVEERGYLYDSSYFPTPAYFAARAAAIGMYRARGRRSSSLVGDGREFLAPRTPFFPSRRERWRKARPAEEARAFVEIPMSTSSPLRLPWLGTTLALARDPVAAALTRAVLLGDAPVVLELHAMDFLGRDDDGVDDALARAQPDLKVPLEDKLRRLEATIRKVVEKRRVVALHTLAAKALAA